MKQDIKSNGILATFVLSALVFSVGCGEAPPAVDSNANTARAEALRKEISSLNAKLDSAQSRVDRLRDQIENGEAPPTEGGLSVPEILDELMQFRLTSKNRNKEQRRLNYLFESLVLQGDAAVPFALPVDGCSTFAAQDGAKMFDVLFVSMFDSEVIDNEGEGCVARAVFV